ncbi:hypothetical protein B2D07_14255 [Desulfococcus multivorans]|nr:hypothetical protein B2D07_14255 [Desulfococcus multivorans]
MPVSIMQVENYDIYFNIICIGTKIKRFGVGVPFIADRRFFEWSWIENESSMLMIRVGILRENP